MKTLHLRKSMSRSLLQRGFPLIPLALAWFALSPAAQAVSPPPDGGYPGNNTAEGDSALFSLTAGLYNTAIGYQALYSNISAYSNTATGAYALYSNTGGFNNTANGLGALSSNTGGNNTATGAYALVSNTTANFNTANGYNALYNNTTGSNNTASGVKALYSNTTGLQNAANGVGALSNNRTGNGNTAEGYGALGTNGGSFNIAVGYNAGANLTTGSNNVDIGNVGVAGESNTLRIGAMSQTATFIRGISGATVAGGVGVIIDSTGHLGTVVSSERFKDEIKPMDKASEAILALKPVTFRYKPELDPEGIPQFGLVAEQVEKVNPDLVARDAKGKPYTVRYEAVNAMLLNEFLKEHRKVEEQDRKLSEQDRKVQEQETSMAQLKSTVAKQEATAARQQEQIEALTSGLQRVSAQVEMSRPVPQMVVNNQ
ncbi:MAG TPA: tail fiber domain-containing protein [Chthoniobacterales bacterium]|nr:tail fiber domain-containing protein [Chthoniobacterales bacterium]